MRSLGRYALLTEEIGGGSMGTVYRASDPLIERTVAVETIDLAKLDDGSLEPRTRFGTPSRFLQLASRSVAAAG